MGARYGSAPSLAFIRRVWAAVSRQPGASAKELALAIGAPESSYGTVAASLRVLRDAGYVAFNDREGRARRVIVPFLVG